MLIFKDIAALKSAIGQSATTSESMEVTQDLVNRFADATKDFQWIHTDPERAKKESPFGGPIAHGFYSLSLIPKFIEGCVKVKSVKMGINYGLNKVRFPSPVPVGSLLKCTSTIEDVQDQPMGGVKIFWTCVVHREGTDKPVCVAEMISLMFE